jgi:Tfp pilus assembly protein FimT
LVDCLAGLALFAILAAVSVPSFTAAAERARTRAAARATASRLALARSVAARRGAIVAVRLDGPAAAPMLTTIVDGNRNGVLSSEVAAGVDVVEGAPVRVSDLFRGVSIRPAGGSPSQYSFTPVGTSSSGTLVIEGDRGTRFGVRVLGTTGRTRLVRFVAATASWEEEP